MAAPVLANRVVVFVNKIGTDDAGYNPVGAPWSRLTIAAALADLLANYPAGTIAEPTELTLGPGTYTVTSDLAIPPNVFVTGSGDADSAVNTVIQLVGSDIILSPDWANGACIGGLANLVVRGEGGVIDFTLPTPGVGNPARKVSIENVTTDVDLVNLEATSTADILNVDHLTHDGNLTNDFKATGGTISVNNTVSRATNTIASKAGFAATALLTANYFAQITLAQVATALTVQADVLSLATIANLTITGAPTLTYITDADGLGYTPSVPANWPVVPVNVQQALDELAAGAGTIAATGTATAANAAGNTTVTPTAHYWTERITFTGAATTRIVIAAVAGRIAGDVMDLFLSRTDGGGIVVEVRNATSGGTLLATFPDGTGTTTGRIQLVYGTIATGYAANAWVAQSFQIPATT